MIPISQLAYQMGVKNIFRLVVPDGEFQGEYDIVDQPEGWEEVDSVVDMNEDNFNVEDFIIGDNLKLKISEYTNKKIFDLIRNVYRVHGGDGRIIFKWFAVKNGIEYDLLGNNFEINMNKDNESFDKSKMLREIELIKAESQNKFVNRQETTIDLFSDKDLDNKDIVPVVAKTIGYKRGESTLTNFYVYDTTQYHSGNYASDNKFFAFTVANREFGTNTNDNCGRNNFDQVSGGQWYTDLGPFVETATTLTLFKLQLSNFKVNCYTPGRNVFPNVRLRIVYRNGVNQVAFKDLATYTEILAGSSGTEHYSQITVEDESFELDNVQPNWNVNFEVIDLDGHDFRMTNLNDDCTIKLTTNIELPLVRTKGVKILDALNQIVKSSTSSEISAISNYIGEGGAFYNSAIATGIYLRGLPEVYLSNKLKTNFKDLFDDGISKIIPMGYDVLSDKVIFEDLRYFFKDIQSYDLSNREYLTEGFKIYNDEDLSYNTLLFGSKKISTKSQNDIKNFVTTSEITTTVTSKKNKFDKQTNLIIDEYKIQELIDDQTNQTNDNDDDLVLIDLVDVETLTDEGVFEDCQHLNENGKLTLKCVTRPFDTTMIEVGSTIIIKEGKNVNNSTQPVYIVESITDRKLVLNKTTGIETGVVDTLISYTLSNFTKNRTNEGFSDPVEIRNLKLATNVRHNPKYQMFRWFPWFGSGLRKKPGTDILKTTNYKNNSLASVKIVPPEMANELQEKIVTGSDETLQHFRDQATTLFSGMLVEIPYRQIRFGEFIDIFNFWRYGINEDRNKSRGYITCNTPVGIYNVYPFGKEMFRHNPNDNTLTIKGKIKGKHVDDPVLLTVDQIDKNTVTLTWDYVDDYVYPVIKIQYSLDGINWQTINEVLNVKTTTFSSPVFDTILTGQNVKFRILVSTADYYNKISNEINIIWQYNNWILKEVSRTENTNCGYSYLTFEIRGTGDFEITWNYEDDPGGGSYSAIDSVSGSVVASFDSIPGVGTTDQQITTLSISSEIRAFYIQLKNTESITLPQNRPLNCNVGNYDLLVNAAINLEIKDLSTNIITDVSVQALTEKKYLYRPTPPGGGGVDEP